MTDATPIDIDRAIVDPRTYESTILRIFAKRTERGLGHDRVVGTGGADVSYFAAATDRAGLARAIARSIAAGDYRPAPVDLWFLETGSKRRTAHTASFVDHVVGSALFRLLTHNARCHGLPGVWSYLPGLTNTGAMSALAHHVREHRRRTGPRGRPLFVLQSDFAAYGDTLPVHPGAPLWRTLRDVASLGRPGGVGDGTFALITALIRPVVRDSDGALSTRVRGVAMGTPLVPLVGNLAVAPMDRALTAIDGAFYARYNDDFLLAHHDPAVLADADRLIDSLVADLGVTRKLSKEVRTALNTPGRPDPDAPAYRGRDRIECLGMTVHAAGTVSLGPHRARRFVARVVARLDACASTLGDLTPADRTRHLVAAANVMLDPQSPFAVAGLAALLDVTTDRGALADTDHRIARALAVAATGRRGMRAHRTVTPSALYTGYGLRSLTALRNAR